MPEAAASLEPDASPPPPAAGESDVDLMRDLGKIKTRQLGEETKVFGETEARMEQDRSYMQDRMKATGLEVEKLRPWNYEEETAKRATNPLEDFGSIGSVFGMIASAFTHAPMEAALNSSASAMNALRAGREKDYEKAYTSWKDNMALVEKREKMIQDGFNDASALMKTDMAAGTIKAQNLAARYGDEQSLFLLNNGMNKEFFELQEKRAQAVERMTKAKDASTESVFRNQVFEGLIKNAPPEKQNDPTYKMHMWNYAHGMNSPQHEKLMTEFWIAHPKATTEDAAAFASKTIRDEKASFGGAGGNTSLTTDRQRAADVLKYRQQLLAEEKPDGTPKYTVEEVAEKAAEFENHLKAKATPASGNQRDAMRSMIDRTKYFESNIDSVENLLTKHNALTGLGGKVTRPAEIVGNIFGSNETDRKQFERWISEMQEWAPRILNESKGRPLASEASKVANIVAGLNMGDTTANTVRAYRELRPLIARIREDLTKREGGTWTPPPSGGQAPPAEGGKWWLRDKRSDAGTNDNVAVRGNISDEEETGREVIDVPPGKDPRDYIPKRRTG